MVLSWHGSSGLYWGGSSGLNWIPSVSARKVIRTTDWQMATII